jgi:hypothetical protein
MKPSGSKSSVGRKDRGSLSKPETDHARNLIKELLEIFNDNPNTSISAESSTNSSPHKLPSRVGKKTDRARFSRNAASRSKEGSSRPEKNPTSRKRSLTREGTEDSDTSLRILDESETWSSYTSDNSDEEVPRTERPKKVQFRR